MFGVNKLNKILLLLVSVVGTGSAIAQVSMFDEDMRGSVYLSVGTNMPTYSASTINIAQGNPGNSSNYTLDKVAADAKSTSKASGFPYNIKIGYFFDYVQTWAVELSYEPVMYHVTDGQNVRMKGTMNELAIDTTIGFSAANGYFYNLDGANMMSVNIVKRFQLFTTKSHNIRLDALAKAGAGPVMPHVYNSIAGKVAEYPSFQLGGWNAGGEAALRLTLMRHVYLEGSYKYSYASYTDVSVYNGSATQKMTVSQVIFSLGYWFSTTKRNPLFVKPPKRAHPLTIKPIYHDPTDLGSSPEPEPDMVEPVEGAPSAPAPSDVPPSEPPPSEPPPSEPPPGE